ncbi:MAG: GntR family transcriptional regulator [Chloroflexota bacterium]
MSNGRVALELPRLDTAPLQERVTNLLRDKIVDRELPGGTRLSIASVAEQLGVSRQPVAVALQRLAQEGYVVVRPRSGTVVTDFDADHFLQALELRLLLEEFAAPLMVARATDADVERIERLYAAAQLRTREGHHAALAARQRLGRDFHQAIIDVAGNVPLSATYRFVYQQCHRVGPVMSAARMKARAAARRTGGRPVNEEHEAVLRALRARDAAGLAAALRAEVARIRADMTAAQRG